MFPYDLTMYKKKCNFDFTCLHRYVFVTTYLKSLIFNFIFIKTLKTFILPDDWVPGHSSSSSST